MKNLGSNQRLIITIAGAVVACLALHFAVFGPMISNWSRTQTQLDSMINQFRTLTFDTPLSLENIDQVRSIVRRYETVIDEQTTALETIQDRLPIYAPPQDLRFGPMLNSILEAMRRIDEVESQTTETRIRILENLGIGIDEAEGRNNTKGFHASRQAVRSYLIRRPTQPNRPRIRGESGTLEFWFKPHWNAAQNTQRRSLALARSSPVTVNRLARDRRAREFVQNQISVGVDGQQMIGTLKTFGYEPVNYTVDINDWQQGQWYHVAMAWDEGQMRLFVNGEPRQQAGTRRGGAAPPRAPVAPGQPRGADAARNHFAEMMARGGAALGRAPAPAHAAARGPENRGPAPDRFQVYDLEELYVGGQPDFTEPADGVFDNLRTLSHANFSFQQVYDGNRPDVLFFDDFENEFIAEHEIEETLDYAGAMLRMIADDSFDFDVRTQLWEKFQNLRSMLGGVSELQTQVATEFASFPKRLYAADIVAQAVNQPATSVLRKLDFKAPADGIMRELYLYLLVGRDIAEHAATAKLDALTTFRYMGGSRDLTDEDLRRWINTRISQLTARSYNEELMAQRAREWNLPMDARERTEQIKTLQDALQQRFPAHWVRSQYETLASRTRDTYYRRVLLNIEVEGTILPITRFLYLLEQETHLVTVEEVVLNQVPERPDRLRVQVRCEAHFIDKPEPYRPSTRVEDPQVRRDTPPEAG